MVEHLNIASENIDGYNIYFVKRWRELGILHGFMDASLDVSDGSDVWNSNLAPLLPGCPKLILLNQTHSSDIIDITSELNFQSSLIGDGWRGFFTKSLKNYVFGIKTADCLPVILIVPSRESFIILHCGWRGIIGGILTSALKELGNKQVSECQICIGPGAGPCCYQIGADNEQIYREEVRRLIKAVPKNSLEQVVTTRKDAIFVDNAKLLLFQALSLGVRENNIILIKKCTICDKNFFSYRREKSLSGRQVSFVCGSRMEW